MRKSVFFASLGLALACAGVAAAESGAYPSKPITLVVPIPPGGAMDLVGRTLADALGSQLQQQVVVENRGGGTSTIGAAQVARAPANGYTLLLAPVTTYAMLAAYPDSAVQFDVRDKLSPIASVSEAPFVLIVGSAVPVRTVEEFIRYAKQNPGRLSHATSGNGSAQDFVGRLFQEVTRTDLLSVPYQGFGPAMADMAAGRVQATFGIPTNALSLGDKGRTLVVASDQRFAALPNVPSSDEVGLPRFKAASYYAIYAGKDTPSTVVERLSQALHAALSSPDIQERFARLAITPFWTTPKGAQELEKREFSKWAAIYNEARK